MKKLILAITVIVVTGAFEQRAAVVIARRPPATAERIISQLDTLSSKVNLLNASGPKTARNEK